MPESAEPLKFTSAIRLATQIAMDCDERVHVFGLGATYPNGLDGTMGDLAARFPDRVHDTPCSESAVTGLAVGAATSGLRPIVHHGRVEFAMFAMDAILTQAAKWNFMFGGDYPCPMVVRIAIGRQWGNGPQHTANYRSMFAVPGLNVVVPSMPDAALGLLYEATKHNGPVIFMEPRWLYKTTTTIDVSGEYRLGRARIVRPGTDVTIVAVGEMVLEALRAAKMAEKIVSAEVIDLVSVYPIDYETIAKSVGRTGRLIVADTTHAEFGVSSEIITALIPKVSGMSNLSRVSIQATPCPTSTHLTAGYYPTWRTILKAMNVGVMGTGPSFEDLHHAPTDNFADLIPA